MKETLHRSCWSTLPLLLTTCIMIPHEERVPYTNELPQFQEGITLKEEVLRLMGRPQAVYADGDELVYADDRHEWTMWVIPLYGQPEESHELYEKHLARFSFDERGILVKLHHEKLSEWHLGSCSYSEFCFGHGNRVARLASEQEDRAAKAFKPSPATCGLYFWPGFVSERHRVVELNQERQGAVIGGGFYYQWTLLPGPHTLRITPEYQVMEIDCVGGELIFATTKRENWWWDGGLKYERLDEKTGRKRLQNRLRLEVESGRSNISR